MMPLSICKVVDEGGNDGDWLGGKQVSKRYGTPAPYSKVIGRESKIDVQFSWHHHDAYQLPDGFPMV